MAELSTTYWIEFFRNAGLPYNVAANYAIIFYDNRIQVDMLMDLSKEYLYDMGIKTMGDVIAILRYSKLFHNQLTKQKMIGEPSVANSSPKSGSPAARIVDHCTKSRATLKPTPPRAKASHSFSVSLAKAQVKLPSSPVKRRITPPESEVLNKKTRRVLPEDEGAYNISMPIGNTERSRKLLQQQNTASLTNKRSSVFQRLGDSQVSSSTDVKRSEVKSNQSSVFKRLGPSSEVTTTSQRNANKANLTVRQAAVPQQQTRGISLKPLPVLKTVQKTSPVFSRIGGGMSKTIDASNFKRTVLNAPSQQVRSGVSQINQILNNSATRSTIGSQSRAVLGTKRVGNIASRIGHQTSRVGIKNLPVKSGQSNMRNIPTARHTMQSSVFQRLGK